jgi:uncharacterized protein (UPF0332 family)
MVKSQWYYDKNVNVKECLEKGLIKKDKPSMEKAKRSIEIALSKLEKARELIKLEILDMCQINCYSAMFHSARALLFKDGFKEKSHYAIYVYLKEKYSDKIGLKFLNELNVLRLDRHEIFYGLEELTFDKEEIKKTLKLCEEFIENVKGLMYK